MILTELYRPKVFSEILGQKEIIEQIKELTKNPSSMPHFLFTSFSPGTGKTSMAYVIKNEIKCPDSDFLVLNSSDERKIESIRTKVKDFARTRRRNDNIPKIVLFDEIDGMLDASQNALRNLMETYSSNVRFIMTANDKTKIIDPIKSRCSHFEFIEIPKDEIKNRIKYICNREKIVIDDDSIIKIIDLHYPDLRQMLNKLQSLGNNITVEKINKDMYLEDEFYHVLKKSKSGYSARKFAIENGLEPKHLLKRTLLNIVDERNRSEYNIGNPIDEQIKQIIWITAEIEYRMAVGADPEIQLWAWIVKYKEVLK